MLLFVLLLLLIPFLVRLRYNHHLPFYNSRLASHCIFRSILFRPLANPPLILLFITKARTQATFNPSPHRQHPLRRSPPHSTPN